MEKDVCQSRVLFNDSSNSSAENFLAALPHVLFQDVFGFMVIFGTPSVELQVYLARPELSTPQEPYDLLSQEMLNASSVGCGNPTVIRGDSVPRSAKTTAMIYRVQIASQTQAREHKYR
jgi:hypothetical protein